MLQKLPSRLIGSANKAFSQRETSTPPLPNGEQERLSSLFRRSPPLTPVIGIVIVKPPFLKDWQNWLEATSAATVKCTNTVP